MCLDLSWIIIHLQVVVQVMQIFSGNNCFEIFLREQ